MGKHLTQIFNELPKDISTYDILDYEQCCKMFKSYRVVAQTTDTNNVRYNTHYLPPDFKSNPLSRLKRILFTDQIAHY